MINTKNEISLKLEETLNQLNAAIRSGRNEAELKQVRADVLDLMRNCIGYYQKNDALGLWEKDNIIQAMAAVNWGWLHLAIACIGNANFDQGQRSNAYPTDKVRSDEISKITDQDLLRIIRKIETQSLM